jgi:hypothetical protein
MLAGWQSTSGAGRGLHTSSAHRNRNALICLWDVQRKPVPILIDVSVNLHPQPPCYLLASKPQARCWQTSWTGLAAPSALRQGAWRGVDAWSTNALWERRRRRGFRGNRLIVHAKDDKNVRRGQPNRPWRPWTWITQKASSIKAQLSVRVIFNVMMLFLLMRLWPIGGRNPVGDPSHTWEVRTSLISLCVTKFCSWQGRT